MSPQFNRLIWKEYRAQRALWVALALASLLIGVAMAWSTGRPALNNLASPLVTLAVVLTIAYATASAAHAFAGEEEDGTAIWLRNFPLKTKTLLSAKVLVAITGSSALFLFAGFTNYLILVFCGVTRQGAAALFLKTEVFTDFEYTVVGGLCFLVIAIFWSLRCSKVFRALGWSGACFYGYGLLVHNSEYGPLSVLPLAVLFTFSVLVLVSARRWHLGLSSLSASQPSATAAVVAASPFTRPGAWLRQKWVNALCRAAQKPTLPGRTAAILFWRELRFAVPFAVVCFGLGLVVVLSRYVSADAMLPLPLFLAIVTTECGLRTFRHDQQKLHGLFWSHRGVSPAFVWLIRNATWYSILVVICTSLVVTEELVFFFWGSEETSYDRMMPTARKFITLLSSRTGVPGSFAAGLGICVTWATSAFVIAQLFSAWIRKPIVATFAGAVGVVVFTIGYGFLHASDIPDWLTAVPLTAVLIVAGFVTRRQWMDRRISWKVVLQRFLWVAVPCACLVPVVRIWRTVQIPVVLETVYDNSVYERYGYSAGNVRGEIPDAWEKFVMAAGNTFSPSTAPRFRPDIALPATQPGIALANLDTILAADLSEIRLPPKHRVPWGRHELSSGVTNVLLREAQALFDRGDFDEALHRVIQAVRLDRYLWQEATNWKQWRHAVVYEQLSLKVLRSMVADDRITEPQLEKAEQSLREAISGWPNDFNVLKNRLMVYRQLLNREGFLWDEYNRIRALENSGASQLWPVTLINANYAERHRMLQLMQLTANQHIETDNPDITGERGHENLQRWISTSVHFETDLTTDVPLYYAQTETAENLLFRDTYNSEQVTQVVIALQRYRRRHGEFPRSLNMLQDFGFTRGDGRFTDIEANAEFGYAAEGFGSALPVIDLAGRPKILAAEQPIIWTHGSVSPYRIQAFADPAVHKVSPVQSGEIHFVSGTHIWYSSANSSFWHQNMSELEKDVAEDEDNNRAENDEAETEQ